MDIFETTSLIDICNIIDTCSIADWSVGADGQEGQYDPTAYVILEELYTVLGHRKEVSSIKLFQNVYDELAYEWHADNSNPTEQTIDSTALVYLDGCHGSQLEVKIDDQTFTYNPQPYDLVVLGSSVLHRAVGDSHGPVMKYTFL